MNDVPQRAALAAALMREFVLRTGVSGDATPWRYLWTDAHAVCNFISLFRRTGEAEWLDLARLLVGQVHQILGRHRSDDSRVGWISGLDETQGAAHPTSGGLRIGKPQPERGPDERYDPHAEWDRDGQYYHYLTKWMHALKAMGNVTGDPIMAHWGAELAVAAYRGFISRTEPPYLHWKMSIDLGRPLVPSAGMHDPLDGWVTARALALGATPRDQASLAPVIVGLRQLCVRGDWSTDDPLGIGGLLFDACRLAQLPLEADMVALIDDLLACVERGLASFLRSGTLRRSVSQRLAFRELGLAIGLCALDSLSEGLAGTFATARVGRLMAYRSLGDEIEGFWLPTERRSNPTWAEHRDINSVMLATRLLPEGFLLT